jgi:hypothetical protein
MNLDPYIVDFISNNWLALSLLLGLLKGVAVLTPSAKDDKIHELLTGLFGQIRGGK